jgi:hypothetical protein
MPNSSRHKLIPTRSDHDLTPHEPLGLSKQASRSGDQGPAAASGPPELARRPSSRAAATLSAELGVDLHGVDAVRTGPRLGANGVRR